MAAPSSWLAGLHQPGLRIGLLLFVTYAYFIAPPSWNPNARFDLVRSLVERGRIDIDPYHANTADKAFREGHFYSDKAPGLSFLAVPIYAAVLAFDRVAGIAPPAAVLLGRDGVPDPGRARGDGEDDVILSPSYRVALYVCCLLTVGLSGALLGGLFLTWSLRQGHGLVPSWLGAATLGLGSLCFPYATMFYGHVPAALLGFMAFALVTDLLAPRRAFLSGLAAGAAVAVEYPAAIMAAAVAWQVIVRGRGYARWVWFAGGAVPLALLAVYHTAAFGNPLRPGYGALARPEFATAMSHGFFGLGWPQPSALFLSLFGRERGLLYVAPVLALAFVGLARGWSRGISGARVGAIVVAAFLLFSSSYALWWGGDALGPRHVIPALPFLCLGIPALVSSLRLRRLALVMLVVSALNLTLATAVGAEVPRDLPHGDVLLDHVYHHVAHGHVPALPGTSNLGHLMGLRGPLSILPPVLLWMIPLAGIGLGEVKPRAT